MCLHCQLLAKKIWCLHKSLYLLSIYKKNICQLIMKNIVCMGSVWCRILSSQNSKSTLEHVEEKEEKNWGAIYLGFNLNMVIACNSPFWQ